ncbi:insulin-like growth factor-binding protein complex acid labile subunit [Centruroides sculpturatus]|uniref:insulin-like growth factor-binding protein complex acid labile subunit n=1 Tax=Centruroides sculpturatus TaxID=218467 RepID=UPI000C6EB66D|nr:insulin-like growth factor-binding protein complex acid labile subunit [Centruroides sculpturatus]
MEALGRIYCLQIVLYVLMLTACCKGNKLNVCPEKEKLINCECEIRYTRLHVVCKNYENFQEMSKSLRSFNDYLVYSLELRHVQLMFLPAHVWKTFSISILTVKSSEVLGLELQDSYEMFGNMMRTLEELRLEQVTGLNSWRWKPFEDCFKLNYVVIRDSDLSAISEDFSFLAPKKINKFELENNKISYLHDKAFAKHEHLMSLDLSKNMITDLKRSMFTVPSKLSLLYLENNKIKKLPDDFFKKMPDLIHVNLANNQLKFLSPDLLRPLTGSHREITLEGNDILCCSSMEELIQLKINKNIKGKCANPSIVRGKEINELEVVDIHHAIYLSTVKGIKSWNWSVFAALKNLQSFDIDSSELGPIGENFKQIPHKILEGLAISNCEIDYIDPHAFSTYENLKLLALIKLNLTEVNRSMLPTMARRLKSISFIGNKLRNLPKDIFTNMPVLEAVYLNNNRFHNLPFEVVKPIIHNKDWRVVLMENDVYCCSDMAWVIPFRLKVPAICKYPQQLRGYQLGLLRKVDFDHGVC